MSSDKFDWIVQFKLASETKATDNLKNYNWNGHKPSYKRFLQNENVPTINCKSN